MIEIKVPGFRNLELEHLVLDYNGTLAIDGKLIPNVRKALKKLSRNLQIHVLTADTFGLAAEEIGNLPVKLTITPNESQADAKLSYISELGSDKVVAIGNGRNDSKMLKAVAVGIVLIQTEGCSVETLISADIVSNSIIEALELLQNPKRLIATLRA